ncbi:NTP pyrophosphohydrolase [Microbacterium paludicola]|uniref:NTP pyrophosphohydrolase n=1 Tax=Microbacterium paludicola TaxID=300019 RepID=UPI0011A53B05|nr:NTP pyrophosphohydrolase [Microbacterium paludicola]
MSIGTVASSAAASLSTPARVPGSIRVRERAIEKVSREASADATGVSRDDVDVEVSEWGGGLAVRVAAKLPIPDLDDTQAISAEPTIVDRVRRLQEAVANDLARVTGREIRRVSFSVTGAIVPTRKRVR